MPSIPPTQRVPFRVFVADDDREMRRMIADALRRDGHFVVEAPDGAALLNDLGHAFYGEEPDGRRSLIISDVKMPGPSGLEVLRRMRTHPWCPTVILITAFGDALAHEEAKRLGAYAMLDKPFDLARLRGLVSEVAGSAGP